MTIRTPHSRMNGTHDVSSHLPGLDELRAELLFLREPHHLLQKDALTRALLLCHHARELGAKSEYAWACHCAALACTALGRLNLSRRLSCMASTGFIHLNDGYGQACVANALGITAERSDQAAQAYVQYELALKLARQGQHTGLEIKVLANRASLAEHLDDLGRAYGIYEEIVAVAQGPERVQALVNAARLALITRRDTESQWFIAQALSDLHLLAIASKRTLIVNTLLHFSAVLVADGNAPKSLDMAVAAHLAAEQAGASLLTRSEAKICLAVAYAALKRKTQSLEAAAEADALLQSAASSLDTTRCRLMLSKVLVDLGERDAARAHLVTAQGEAIILSAVPGVQGSFGALTLLAQVLRARADLEEAARDFAQALLFHHQYHDLDRENFKRGRAEYAQAANEIYDLHHETELTTELHIMHKRLLQAASEDPLTGALNRQAFREQVDQILLPFRFPETEPSSRCSAPNSSLALVLLNIDEFKCINKTFGVSAGDAVLIQVVEICRHLLPEGAWLARWSEEEFVVMLPETDLGGAVRMCERIREELLAWNWSAVHTGLTVTASFGLGAWSPEDLSNDFSDALLQVDQAIHRTKSAGRDRVELVLPLHRHVFH